MTRVTETMARDAWVDLLRALGIIGPTDRETMGYNVGRGWWIERHAPGDRVYWGVWMDGVEVHVGWSTRELWCACQLAAETHRRVTRTT